MIGSRLLMVDYFLLRVIFTTTQCTITLEKPNARNIRLAIIPNEPLKFGVWSNKSQPIILDDDAVTHDFFRPKKTKTI
jgi:hypothetical protein